MKDEIGRYLVAYENALWRQMKRISEDSKSEEALYALFKEHLRMQGLITSAMWEAAALKVPESASS